MRKIIIGLLLLISNISFCQKNDLQVLSEEKVLGKNLLTNTDIKGYQYIFPEKIHETFLDTTSGFLTVQLRGLSKNGKWLNNKGNIFQYDLNNKKLLWTKKIVYQTSGLQQFSKTIIYTTANKSYCLDVNTGNELWELKNNIYYVDPIENIGVGYKFKSSMGYSNELEGIDLETGNIVWKKELNREYGWNNLFFLDDSTMVVVAAGLHAININTGEGWDYNTVTGKKDYTETIATNAVGVVAGLLTGAFMMSTGHNLVRDLVSNVLVDSSYIYFASKEQLAKIDKQTGDINWKYPFLKDLPSKSSIVMNDSLIFMINKGFAYMGNRQIDFGTPFIAAYDKTSGSQKYLSLINTKDDPILGYKILNNEIYLVFKNRMAKYAIDTGALLIEKDFTDESLGELKYFIGNQVFITNDQNDLESLPQSDTTKVFVYTSKSKTLSIDNLLNIIDTIEFEELSFHYLNSKNYKFISKDKKTLIIDDEGKRIAELNTSLNAFIVGETLYDRQDDSFLVIELDEIMNK